MEQAQYNQLFSFIWNIATDVLVYAFDKGEYKKIIMPIMGHRTKRFFQWSGKMGERL